MTRAIVSTTACWCLLWSAVVAEAAAPAAAAPAVPAISVDKACYVNTVPNHGSPMTVTGTGFTPGDTVALSGGTVKAQVTVAADGSFSVTTPAPELTPGPGSARTTISATDLAPGAPVAAVTTVARSANLAVGEGQGLIGHGKVLFSFSGFTPGKGVYGYYLWHRRVVAHSRFGRAGGPCGVLTQRAQPYPGGHPKHSLYKVVFESQSRYRAGAVPEVTGRLRLSPF